MKLIAFENKGSAGIGYLLDDGKTLNVLELSDVNPESGILDIITGQLSQEEILKGAAGSLLLADVSVRAPIPRPRRNVFCVGRNYHAHANELSDSIFKGSTVVDQWPIIFTKVPESVVGPNDDVRLPKGISSDIDYEAELGLVIGKQGKNISKDDALNHVYGYTIINDVTARDVQVRHQQWHLGKSFDTFCPMGPWLVTSDELDIGNINIKCTVNDEIRQEANTRDLIFDIPAIIEACSRGITLYPGDVIATGTPAGVGMGMNPPRYLKDGDVVRVDIEGIGSIQNTFKL